MKQLSLLSIIFFLAACTTHPHSDGRDTYLKKVDQHSAGDKQFSGVYHNFEFRSTLLTRDMSRALHNRLNQYYDWSEEEALSKLNERMNELNNKTKIWLSFYTPERKNDNLANKISIWKIYLETNGQRYEGRPYKANKNFSEAQALIHYHSRWATAYYVDFPLPTDDIGSTAKLIITGPLGRREVDFNSL